jgi:hypothetical protein
MKLVDKYSSICTATPGSGETIMFCNDTWFGITHAKEFLRMHSFALNTLLSVKEVHLSKDRANIFYRPLSQ